IAFLSHLRPNNKSKKPITKRRTSRGINVTKATPRVAMITASVATAANAPTIELRQLTVIPATRTSVNASTNSTDAARNAAITIAHCIYFFSFILLLVQGLFASSIKSIKLFLAEPDRRTNHVLIKMLHLRSSRNRQHRARAFEEPGERNLTGLGVVSPGDLVEGTPGASQFSSCQRGPGDKADTLAGAEIYHRLGLGNRHMFGLAHRQIIVILHSDNRYDLLGSCQLIDRDVRQSDMANLPFLPHLREFTYRVLKWNLGVRAMELIDVNAIEAQTPQAALQGLTKMLGASVLRPLIRASTQEAPFGRDDQVFRIGVERFGNQ